MIPVQIQWIITESVVITMSRKCQLLMGYCNKGPGHSNTNRIERFQIEATSSSLKVPLPINVIVYSYWQKRYGNCIDTEEMRVHTRVACDKGNGVVVCTNRECQFSSKKNDHDPSNRCHGISWYRTSSRYNPFTFHVNSSISESSNSMSTTGSWLGSMTRLHSNRIEGITTITD